MFVWTFWDYCYCSYEIFLKTWYKTIISNYTASFANFHVSNSINVHIFFTRHVLQLLITLKREELPIVSTFRENWAHLTIIFEFFKDQIVDNYPFLWFFRNRTLTLLSVGWMDPATHLFLKFGRSNEAEMTKNTEVKLTIPNFCNLRPKIFKQNSTENSESLFTMFPKSWKFGKAQVYNKKSSEHFSHIWRNVEIYWHK